MRQLLRLVTLTALVFPAPGTVAAQPNLPAPVQTAVPQGQGALAASPSDFDFLEGTWDIVYNNAAPNVPPNVRGTWTAMKQADGRVLYDEFRLFGPGDITIALGLTYRVFDENKHRWDMRYVAVVGPGPDGRTPQKIANWAELTGWRDGATVRVDQRSGSTQLRITYYDITPQQFSWKADVSNDNGQTWKQDQIRIKATRAGR